MKIKIDQLENDSKLKMAGNNCEESDSCKKSWNIIPDDLIPFLLMFTFLNYDLSVSPIDKLKIKESKSKESIIYYQITVQENLNKSNTINSTF